MSGYFNKDIYSFSIAHFPSRMCTVIYDPCRMESAEGGYLSDSLDEKEGLNGVAAAGVTLHSL